MTTNRVGVLIGIALMTTVAGAGQDDATVPDAAACVSIADTAQRLHCYDAAHRRSASAAATSDTLPQPAPLPLSSTAARRSAGPDSDDAGDILATLWDLGPPRKHRTFNLRAHNGTYLLPFRYTDRVNETPFSPAPEHSLSEAQPTDAVEAKFQISTKFKVVEDLIGDNGDLWFGYTQQSNWQLYNRDLSAPFRETDYEPEIIFTWHTRAELLGWDWSLLNLGFAHQSNGRSLPLSRSWNRLYAQFGLTRGKVALLLRPWYRLREPAKTDDNPDIGDYMGSGDMRVSYTRKGHAVSLLGRLADTGKGAAQLDWIFPISGPLKGYLQASHGYGENLLDYNHLQTTVGLGIFLLSWE